MMAAKTKTVFVCAECGAETPKWAGKCPSCGTWNSLNEEIVKKESAVSYGVAAARSASAHKLDEISAENEHRYKTGIRELDRVLGGGLVKGSLVLLSGEPGIGKSTMLLQICGKLAVEGQILYVSGEESVRQLKLRADRLKIDNTELLIMSETDPQAVAEYVRIHKPAVVVVDSIQTMNISEISSASGSVTQVRESANLLLRLAKTEDIPIILVGHVNRDGAIAGPKVMEHIVDAVLYFEGEKLHTYRILRAIKNRFGSTNEIGVFDMTDRGLEEVENPSAMLISDRIRNVSGTCVACVLEGSRPILAEIQSLVTPTGFGNPRRMSTGFDNNRLNMIIAVLEKRMGFFFSNMDTYLNVVGGLRLDEPAVDLAVAMALVSGIRDIPVPEDVIAFGEIGLSGELRSVPQVAARVSEAARLGFTRCIVPESCKGQLKGLVTERPIQIIGARTVRQAVEIIG